MTSNMCFYLDSAAQANPPTPEEETVIIETNEPMTVAVYEFGGYPSLDSAKEAQMFAKKLGKRKFQVIYFEKKTLWNSLYHKTINQILFITYIENNSAIPN